MTQQISKSLYLIGTQCPYWLYKQLHEPETLPEPDEFTKNLFDIGYEVESLANTLYDKKYLQKTLTYENYQARIDVLTDNEIIEIKSSTSIKPIHIQDLAFQRFLAEKNNLQITSYKVLHLNKDYIKQGTLNIQELFTLTDVTEEVLNTPIKDIQPINNPLCTCKPAYSCPAHEQFINDLPQGNVFELSRGKAKAFKLYEQGITKLKDITNTKLTEKQQIQVQADITNQPYISKEHIKHFLNSLNYPLYHLDFEAIQPAIPQFDQSRPYQQIPFQYSLHIQEKNNQVTHKEFLAESIGDPRPSFLDSLKEHLHNSEGDIIVYNQSYEIARLKELAVDFPEHESWIQEIIPRIKDLLIPFRNFYYYNPTQKGSASIKKVLPAVTGKNYDNLEINNGALASKSFEDLYKEPNEQTRINLLEYCKLDTEGMVWIVNELKKLVNLPD